MKEIGEEKNCGGGHDNRRVTVFKYSSIVTKIIVFFSEKLFHHVSFGFFGIQFGTILYQWGG